MGSRASRRGSKLLKIRPQRSSHKRRSSELRKASPPEPDNESQVKDDSKGSNGDKSQQPEETEITVQKKDSMDTQAGDKLTSSTSATEMLAQDARHQEDLSSSRNETQYTLLSEKEGQDHRTDNTTKASSEEENWNSSSTELEAKAPAVP